uniref:Uncharacterized protein n=1 Tax=Sarcophilus harrisii TaxID=9305 RepID=A0A7N4NVU5_SARHA
LPPLSLFCFLFCLYCYQRSIRKMKGCELAQRIKQLHIDGYHHVSLANWKSDLVQGFWTNARNYGQKDPSASVYNLSKIIKFYKYYFMTPYSCMHDKNEHLSKAIFAHFFIVSFPFLFRVAWRKKCQGKDLFKHLKGCNLLPATFRSYNSPCFFCKRSFFRSNIVFFFS